jgi:hypothetical protein
VGIASAISPIEYDFNTQEVSIDLTLVAADSALTSVFAAQNLNVQTKTSNYELALTDRSSLIVVDSSSNLTVTIPNEATADFPVGTKIDLFRQGTGTVTVVGAAGVTRLSRETRTQLAARYSGATVAKIAPNTWLFVGDLL